MKRSAGVLLILAGFMSADLRADWPRELFQKSYQQLNQKTHQGRYFITGAQPQTGTFKATFQMPQSLTWSMTDAESKQEQSFAWNQKQEIVTSSRAQDTSDPLVSVFDSILGRKAIQAMLGTIHDWQKPEAIASKFVNMSAKFEDGHQVLTVVPAVPMLKGYVWNWIVDSNGKVPRVLEWRVANQGSEYLFEFQGEKK